MDESTMHQMDNNDNPIIQSLEALLSGEEHTEIPSHDSFEEMRSKFKESCSLDQSKDSGINYSNMSFASRHLQSMDISVGNVSWYFETCQYQSLKLNYFILFYSNQQNLDLQVNRLMGHSTSSH